MRLRLSLLSLLAGCLLAAAAGSAYAGPRVIYPAPDETGALYDYTVPDSYRLALLTEALKRSHRGYELQAATVRMPQGRLIQQLKAGLDVDVAWTMTSIEREQELQPIRIPLYKGLIGWRLLLVRSADLPKFAAIRSLVPLKALVAVQGEDWPDTAILRAAGFEVRTALHHAPLFSMLAGGRGDFFPRSVFEIWKEADLYRDLGLVVEPNLVLRYRAASYFFVRKGNEQLAHDIRTGLEAMIADGTFDRLFHQYHDAALRQAHLGSRRILDLPNPELPRETPLARKALWYQP
ncbi:MAG: substrate-binding periplasmic protein [Telluria sp.]